ncbi:MAG: thioredoxin [Spirochaetaceae bacterium]|nr:thioredoxin [Spirochaetaceae bacterium]
MGLEVTITSGNFKDEVLQSPVPVLVDFWADWCRPCKAVAPILEQIAEAYSGRIKIGKVNVDEENDLAGQHSIVSIPTMFLYKDGKVVRQVTGALPRHELEQLFKNLI